MLHLRVGDDRHLGHEAVEGASFVALAWFDRMVRALEPFEVTLTFCFTPEHRGIAPHHTSPPQVPEEFAEFCAQMVRRYAPDVPLPLARAG